MYRIYTLFLPMLLLSLLARAQQVLSLEVDQAITPVTADYIHRGLESARTENATCVLIRLNTPGGLLSSTRRIVGDILESPVPVVVYVAPGGARAGSAGVFITMAASVAAMAPGTNIGASHPVNLPGNADSVMSEKMTNDAAAFMRTIAQRRSRNAAWAEDAVRHSVSITEQEALEAGVINLVAAGTRALMDSLDGMRVPAGRDSLVLRTAQAGIRELSMSFSERLLSLISDPNIMYVLMLLGIFGILFEFFNPGAIFPGVIGGISLILAFYAMSVLPVNYAGLALIGFAILLFLLEIKIVSHGILGAGGVISLLIGSLMLMRTPSGMEYARISLAVIIPAVIVTALFFFFLVGMGLRAQRARPVTGAEGFIGETGTVIEALAPLGRVHVHGEIWSAESVGGPVAAGEKVRVTALKGLKIFVEPLSGDA